MAFSIVRRDQWAGLERLDSSCLGHVLLEILEIECHKCVHLLIRFQESIAGKQIVRRCGGESIVDGLGDGAG